MICSRKLFKRLISISLLVGSLALASCGSDNKSKGNSSNINNFGIGGTAPGATVACNGPLVQMNLHTTQQSYNGSAIQGSFLDGHINGGNADQAFYGSNQVGDSIQVYKMVSGNNYVGLNIVLTLCDSAQFGLDIAHRGRNILNGALVLNSNLNCSGGSVDYAQFLINLHSYQKPGQNFSANSVSVPVYFSGQCQNQQNSY